LKNKTDTIGITNSSIELAIITFAGKDVDWGQQVKMICGRAWPLKLPSLLLLLWYIHWRLSSDQTVIPREGRPYQKKIWKNNSELR